MQALCDEAALLRALIKEDNLTTFCKLCTYTRTGTTKLLNTHALLLITQNLKQVPCIVMSQSSSHGTFQCPNQGGCDSPVTMATQYVIPNAKVGTCMQ